MSDSGFYTPARWISGTIQATRIVFVIFGLFGNSLCGGVFLKRLPQQRGPTNVFFLMLGIMDAVYIICINVFTFASNLNSPVDFTIKVKCIQRNHFSVSQSTSS